MAGVGVDNLLLGDNSNLLLSDGTSVLLLGTYNPNVIVDISSSIVIQVSINPISINTSQNIDINSQLITINQFDAIVPMNTSISLDVQDLFTTIKSVAVELSATPTINPIDLTFTAQDISFTSTAELDIGISDISIIQSNVAVTTEPTNVAINLDVSTISITTLRTTTSYDHLLLGNLSDLLLSDGSNLLINEGTIVDLESSLINITPLNVTVTVDIDVEINLDAITATFIPLQAMGTVFQTIDGTGVIPIDLGEPLGINTIHIEAYYMQNATHNEYVNLQSLTLNIVTNIMPVDTEVHLGVLDIHITSLGASVPNRSIKRVSQIGNAIFNPTLLWGLNNYVDNFISVRGLAIDGSSVLSVMELGQFSKKVEISGEFISNDIINDIIIHENEFEIIFSDGGTQIAKFDLINTPLSITPKYEGADYSDITIRVLI